MEFALGIDIGSNFTKAVLCKGYTVISYSLAPSGGDYRLSAKMVVEETLKKSGLNENVISHIASTGYGSSLIENSHKRFTDIACHAAAIFLMFPSVKTIIDIGAQFSKVIRLNEKGQVTNFLLSEKCAGGSGKFLQLISKILHIDIDKMGKLSLTSQNPVQFTTGCAVFAESEAISRIAEGELVEDILAGVNNAMASKIYSLVIRLGLDGDCAITGGGAKNIGLVNAVEKALNIKLFVSNEPQITAAFGASILAQE